MTAQIFGHFSTAQLEYLYRMHLSYLVGTEYVPTVLLHNLIFQLFPYFALIPHFFIALRFSVIKFD